MTLYYCMVAPLGLMEEKEKIGNIQRYGKAFAKILEARPNKTGAWPHTFHLTNQPSKITITHWALLKK